MLYLLRATGVFTAIALTMGCSKSDGGGSGAKSAGGAAGMTTGGTGNGGTSSGKGGSGGTSGSSGSGGTSKGGTGPTGLPTVPGDPDTSVTTTLPPLPRLQAVRATATGDAVKISVEPVDGAKDYRVYVLPSDSDVMPRSDGHLTVRNAIYRCAGTRETPTLVQDNMQLNQSEAVKTIVEAEVDGYRRTLADATLGHVYVTPGEGRVPVYAMGRPDGDADNSCFHQRWNETRAKEYITSETDRRAKLAARWRDDGIVFYVPAPGAAGTKPVYGAGMDPRLYWVDGAEASSRGNGTVAFNVLSAAALPDTVPLMRVHYDMGCSYGSHDELVAGMPRFERARYQGDELPMFDLHYSGIRPDTTLVVEALADGCPAKVVIAPMTRAAGTDDGVQYPAYSTVADAQAASSTGEVFINGHHDAMNDPRPIARSFVKISPGPKPDMDWFAGFGPDEDLSAFDSLSFNAPCENRANPNCTQEQRSTNAWGDIAFMGNTFNRNGIAPMMGELWVTFADWMADVGGKVRITPNTRATMSSSNFLHVTMQVDAYTTARRYPQIIISDGDVPVQANLETSNSIIVQTFSDVSTPNWPYAFQLEVCDHRAWEVNDQCPATDFYRITSGDGTVTGLGAGPEVGERTGADRATSMDVFVSTQRAYLFLDNEPYGCVDLPDSGIPSGQVTVTFGDVIYHSGVDSVFAFHRAHQQQFAKRHFDNLGFKSGVEAPMWDEGRFPCFPPSSIIPR
jgi:hypothetical protein